MLKDTKSLGNNKAPACESRGFVHKKRGVHFDTPPFSFIVGYANARQRKTLIRSVWIGYRICFTLPHIQKLKKNFSMELTIIETSAYQELRKLVSTLAVQMSDFQKKIAPPAPDK